MQLGKPFRKFQLLAADVDAAESGFLALDLIGQVVGVHRQKPAHAGAFVFQIAGGLGFATVVHHVVLQLAKHKMQHVVKVHANIGGHAKRLARVALPAFQVPLATAGDVGQLYIKLGVGRCGGHFLPQRQNGIVVAKLQNIEHALAGFVLHQRQVVQQLGRGHQRFFADHIRTQTQAGGNVRVVQVVGRANGHVVQRRGGVALQAVGIIVKALKIGKKLALRRNAVNDAHRVVGVVSHGQMVAQVFDGVHVARGNVAGGADEGEVLAIAHDLECSLS